MYSFFFCENATAKTSIMCIYVSVYNKLFSVIHSMWMRVVAVIYMLYVVATAAVFEAVFWIHIVHTTLPNV